MSSLITNYQKIVKKLEYLSQQDMNYCPYLANRTLIQQSKILIVSKRQSTEKILPFLQSGYTEFGENQVQEAQEKWKSLKKSYPQTKLHMIGHLQSKKARQAIELFDVIQSVDSEKLATKLSNISNELNKYPELFIQINIGNEPQKYGISTPNVKDFYKFLTQELNMKVTGLMALLPITDNPNPYFAIMQNLKIKLNIKKLSMGMSNDFLHAALFNTDYIRIGRQIFGERKYDKS